VSAVLKITPGLNFATTEEDVAHLKLGKVATLVRTHAVSFSLRGLVTFRHLARLLHKNKTFLFWPVLTVAEIK
jgi:hypothetical protein